MLLRIDDLDQGRCRPDFEAALREDLAWLGLTWPPAVRRQSAHLSAYADALDRLRAQGLIYPCFCTRKDIAAAASAAHGPEGLIYPGTCRGLSAAAQMARQDAGQSPAWRLDHQAALAAAGPLTWTEVGARDPGDWPVDLSQIGDVVLGRRDAVGSYHLAVVIDDAATGVTHVTRGEDLRFASPLHRLLIHLLGLPVPVWVHHGLVVDHAGKRLAKRDDARSLRSYRDAGLSPAQVIELAHQGHNGAPVAPS